MQSQFSKYYPWETFSKGKQHREVRFRISSLPIGVADQPFWEVFVILVGGNPVSNRCFQDSDALLFGQKPYGLKSKFTIVLPKTQNVSPNRMFHFHSPKNV